MTIAPAKYARKPFFIDAVQVTAENMEEVAKWAQGEIRATTEPNITPKGNYIHVRVQRPMNERQSRAFAGDWVLYAGSGYKVYSNKAFLNSFELAVE